MKTNFVSPTLIALAIAGAVALGSRIQAAETTAVAPASSSGLPDDIQPGTPAAQVVKLVQAGVDASVIQTYVTDCRSAFNLDADKIIALTDAGVPGDLINAMIAHDKNFLASLPTAEQPATASTEPPPETNTADTTATPEASVPPEPVTVNYFYNTLNPYGSWVNVEGYGLCWRPTVVVYDSGWRPYCDRGHWVYTDCGWYWDSDYAWGATFHYGRWFNSPRYGWCWWPDTVWAPSWVTWRSSTDYCGWAPLPPFSVYQPGIGFTYRGKNVSVGFGFGLASSCFTFVSASHFCEPHPRYYCVPQHEVVQIYNRSAVCNNYDWHNHFIVNNGVSVTVIGSATRHPIQPVSIGSLVNVHRHGWHGESVRHQEHPFSTSNSNGSETRHFTATGRDHNPVSHRENSENGTREHVERHETFNTHSPAANHRDEQNDRGHGSGAENPSNHRDQHDQRFVNGNQNNSAQSWQHATAPDNNNHNRVTYVPSSQNNQTHNNSMANGVEHRQSGRSFTSSVVENPPAPVITTTPVRPSRPVIVPTRIAQNTPSHSESYQPTHQMNQQRSFPAPTISVGSPQRSEPRQNIVQYTPQHITPANASAPAAVHYQNALPNANDRAQGRKERDH